MNEKLTDFEIMAPVGSRDSLIAALKAGAGSVYFGVEQLNMRSHSANHFTIDDLREIAATCKEHGVKSYLRKAIGSWVLRTRALRTSPFW